MRVLTKDEQKEAVRLICYLVDGCSFVSSRAFKGGSCAQENGRGFDCPSCAAKTFLYRVEQCES